MNTSFDIIQRDDVMTGYNETAPLHVATNHVLLVTNVTQLPVELQDGVLKIIKHAPHKNFVDENDMQEENGPEYKWHLRLVLSHLVVEYLEQQTKRKAF